MLLESLIQILGGGTISGYIMWLWLDSVKKDRLDLINRLDSEQQSRITELKEMLPLLMDASKGLQNVIKSHTTNNSKMMVDLKNHIDDKVIEISARCKKK